MKKIIAILLCIVCIFSVALVSCDENPEDVAENEKEIAKLDGKTPQELYAETQQKLKSYTRFKAVTEQTIVMKADGMEITMLQTVTSEMDGQNSYFHSYAKNDITGVIENEGWFVDGIIYSNTANGKFKVELSYDDYIKNYLGSDPSESMLLAIPESWFNDIKYTKEGDSYFMIFTISGEKYEELMGNVGINGVDEIKDVTYKVEFDAKGTLLGIVTEFEMTVMGVQATCVSVSEVIVDGLLPITVPADADSYQPGALNR